MTIDKLTALGFTINLSPVPPTGPEPVRAIRCELWQDGKLVASAEAPAQQPSDSKLAEQEMSAAINAAWEQLLQSIDF